MRFHRSLLIVQPFFLAIGLTATTAAQSGPGFPGFGWGTPYDRIQRVEAFQSSELDERADQVKVRVDHLGEAKLEDCEFEFNNGLFSGIIIMTRGEKNTVALHAYLTSRFGEVKESEPRFWQWLAGDTYVSLDEDSGGDGYVLWYGIDWQQDGTKQKEQ